MARWVDHARVLCLDTGAFSSFVGSEWASSRWSGRSFICHVVELILLQSDGTIKVKEPERLK